MPYSSLVLTSGLLASVHQWLVRQGFNSRLSHTRDLKKKMVPDAGLLNTQHYKVWIKGKVEQSRE